MDSTKLLGSLNLFETIEPADLAALSQRLERVEIEAGKIIFEQGAKGGRLFIIEAGRVDIFHGDGKNSVRLTTLGAGQYFGELSLFDGEPRSARALAVDRCLLLALDRADFVEFTSKHPESAIRVMAELAQRLRHTNAAFSSQVSRNVLKDEEEQLTVGQRVADRVATFGGSWPFIGMFGAFMASWMMLNASKHAPFDPYPFILLNLMLSTVAALQAPIIMMSQNRQAAKDKLLAENDYQVNLKSELGIQSLLKGQTELGARLSLLESQLLATSRRGAPAGDPSH